MCTLKSIALTVFYFIPITIIIDYALEKCPLSLLFTDMLVTCHKIYFGM